jgi:hypothetical protein
MAKAKNTFIKSKMNKDLDARVLSTSEYRNAVNVQVSKSEGEQVGSLENVLGNTVVADIGVHTGAVGLECIGQVVDDSNSMAYLFYTNHSGNLKNYNPAAKNFIVSLNIKNNSLNTLVEGAFLNFSTQNPIYGVNVLEDLLFWTDNRNQPRKINISAATNVFNYYLTEDQISVAKYNPYAPIELYVESDLSIGNYESTMKDVSSFYLPNGGKGLIEAPVTSGDTQVNLSTLEGDIVQAGGEYGSNGATVSYTTISDPPEIIPVAGVTVDTFTYNDPLWEITVTGGTLPDLDAATQSIVLNANPYYDKDYAGDPTYLEDKFVRFGYRFKFDDEECSLFSTFTQSAFIPKQDGYFMYVEKPEADNVNSINDQDEAFRSTIVSFVENKVDSIKLRIPLPFNNYELESSLKIKSIDLLYKESDGIPVKVIDTIDMSKVFGSAAICDVATDNLAPFTSVAVDNVRGGINIGDTVVGSGISTLVTVVSYTPDDENQNPSTSGTIELSSAQTLTEDTALTIGEPEYYTYDYQAKKPFKTLPEKDLTRVYDKIPVRSFAQEVSGNRVIYGNFQNKHTAPDSLDYNVAITPKSSFNLNETTIDYTGGGGVFPPGTPIDVDFLGELYAGRVITSTDPNVIIPDGTVVSSTNNNGEGVFITGLMASSGSSDDFLVKETNGFIPVGAVVSGNGVIPGTTVLSVVVGGGSLGDNEQYVTCSSVVTLVENQPVYFGSTSQTEAVISLNNEVTFPAGPVALYLNPGGDVQDTTSTIEYPNHSLKTNRNYQVGVVLSDRFGRQSGVILSNNKELITIGNNKFIGSTVYSPYIEENLDVDEWPGNSIKLLFNKTIATAYNPSVGIPGVYNGDPASIDYNPLGWYTFKIVVKQTEQEYYNVYLPGIMASYPDNTTLEVGKTSHVVLISDNINKVPRDLSEVGPVQDQFRSSVQLYGRVENSSTKVTEALENMGLSNLQYYPGRTFDFASTISTVGDLFDYNPQDPPNPNLFPQFYSLESNPYIARINTANKIGQIANVNFTAVSGLIAVTATTDTLQLSSISGIGGDIEIGDKVVGAGFPTDLTVAAAFVGPSQGRDGCEVASGVTGNIVSVIANTGSPNQIQAGMVLETQSGIPEGTVVLNVTLNGLNNDVTVNNVVDLIAGTLIDFSNPARLVVSSPVSVTIGEEVNIYSSESPGIQFLSVYETKPVESLLDIFWETSTTGRIKDINDIIINENPTGTGAGGLSPWNDNPFLESLRGNLGEDCLQAPVYLVDNFGARISSNDITSPLVLDSVFNQQDPQVNVQTDYTFGPSPIEQQPVFSFEETAPGSYEYMLKTDNGFSSFIYYGEDEGARNFTLNFSAEVNGLPISITQDMSLGNVSPHIPTSSGNSSSVRPLFAQSNVSTLIVTGGSSNIQIGDDVTTLVFYPDQLPLGLVVAGGGFTPSNTAFSGYGIANSVSDSLTIELYAYQDSAVDVYDIMTVAAGSSGSIPTRTYVVSKSAIVNDKFTVTLSNEVTLNMYSVNQDTFNFTTPATLEVSQNVTVASNQILNVQNLSEIWDDCPVGPIFPGGTDVRYVGELRAVNGAGWRATDLTGNHQKTEDLTFTKTTEVRAAGTAGATDTDFFQFENPGSAAFNVAAKVDIVNTGYQNSNMPAGVYTVGYEVSDPGDTIQCKVLINTGLKICEIQEWTLHAYYRAQGNDGPYEGKFIFVKVCDPNGNGGFYYDENFVLQARPVYNGWYGWRSGSNTAENSGDFPSWQNLVANNGGSNIIIDPYSGAPGNDSGFGWTGRSNYLNDWQPPSATYPFYGLKSIIQKDSTTTGGDLWPSGNIPYRLPPYWELTAGTGSNTPLVPALENYAWSGTFQ